MQYKRVYLFRVFHFCANIYVFFTFSLFLFYFYTNLHFIDWNFYVVYFAHEFVIFFNWRQNV